MICNRGKNMKCIFCEIINGTLPKRLIYEDEHTLAFLDIADDVDGHTIVVPRKHISNILDCDGETLTHLMQIVQLISKHYVNCCGYQGVNLLNESGAEAQQSVPHLHIHIIPRKHGDGIDAWPAFTGGTQSLDATHQKLKINNA